MKTNRSRIKGSLLLAALMAGCLWVGAELRVESSARADSRTKPPPEHFQSGSERSIPILKEISATLKRIDAKLANIERAAREKKP